MTFVRRFLAAWREAKSQAQYSEFADTSPSWGPDDATWLRQVLDSYHGRRLKAQITNSVFRAAWDACSKQTNGDFDRGVAYGVAKLKNAFESYANAELFRKEDLTSVEDANSTSFGTEEPAPAL